jgi:hypothetical protein
VVSWRRRKEQPADGAGTAPETGEETGRDAAQGPTGEAAGEGTAHGAGEAPATRPRRPRRPLDVTEVTDQLPRVDLGALRVPALAGMELRMELEEGTKRVVAVTVGLAGSTAQIQVFAAPRTEGIWQEVREEIAASVTRQGGAAEEAAGPFGVEVLARMPARTPDGRTGHRPSRFLGVDGPRWFLRAVLSGPAAVDRTAARPLELLLSGCVVVRGSEAMAPRDLLPLKLPASAQAMPVRHAAPARAPQAEGAPPAGGAPPAEGAPPVEGPAASEAGGGRPGA